MLNCFKSHGLSIKTTPGTDRAIIKGTGVVQEDHLLHVTGVVYEGPMSYVINTTPAPSPAREQVFVACIHTGFGGG
jgi:hypothetical protein